MSHERTSSAVSRETLAAAGFEPAESAGLFVGVSRFADSGFAPVPFAVDDAIDLAHLFALELRLIEPAKVTLALAGEPKKPETAERLAVLTSGGARQTEAKQTDIYSLLRDQGQQSGQHGLFVTSIATHGFSDQGGDFLVAADSLRHRIERTGVAVDEIFDDISRVSSPRRLVLLDACRERLTAETRALGETASAMSRGFAQAIASARGQVVLAGATLGGYAYDDPRLGNGVFSAAVIDGLRGAAGVDERGFVTVRTLADYVDVRVAAWVRENVPDHAARSRGIARRIEGAASWIPLAVDPEHRAARDAYRQRREAALGKLKENLGQTITGALYDKIFGLLSADEPTAKTEELLGEIEALDGTVRLRRSLVFYLESQRTAEAPSTDRGTSQGATETTAKATAKTTEVATPPPRYGMRRTLIAILAMTAVVTLGWRLWPSGELETTGGDRATHSSSPSWEVNPEGTPPVEPSLAVESAGDGVAGGMDPAEDASGPSDSPPPPPPPPPASNQPVDTSSEETSPPATVDSRMETPTGMRGEPPPSEGAKQDSPSSTTSPITTVAATPVLPPHCQAAVAKTGIELVYVPGGEYTLGADDVDDNSKPIHRVTLSAFWIGKHPVTNEQYRRFVEAAGHREPRYWDEDRFKAPRQPVVGVSWVDAKAYVEWAGLSLPSEAQWEAAARGTDQRRYPWGSEAPTAELADFGKNYSSGRPDPVGSHPQGAGPFKGEDQAGGVWEWCEDVWDSKAHAARDGAVDPVTPLQKEQDESFTHRVVRGGSWALQPRLLPAAFRLGDWAGDRFQGIGFRVVCGPAPEP